LLIVDRPIAVRAPSIRSIAVKLIDDARSSNAFARGLAFNVGDEA
jgi:hypothetical protein